MSTVEGSHKKSRKRKHQDEDEADAGPAKKSKSGMRSDRRLERVKENTHRPRDPTTPLGEHRVKDKSKREIKRDQRKRQRKAAASGTLVEVAEDVVPEDAVDYDAVEARKERRRQKKKEQKKTARPGNQEAKAGKVAKTAKKPKSKLRTKWELFDAEAGRFINHDPLFVRDADGEAYIIAAVQRELHVLSIETSLLVRTMLAPDAATIIGFALESPESNLVHIADTGGNMLVWDWTNDIEPRYGPLSAGYLKAIAAMRLDDNDEAEVPYITRLDDLNVVRSGERILYQTQEDLQSIQLLGKADYVLARGAERVVIGRRKETKDYTWIELPLTKTATCMDARVVPPPLGSKKASKRPPQLQLAIGYEDGQIHLYDDVSQLLVQGQQQVLPAPRILHWHRSAVPAVKFNPDGSYLISGGKETVLVLWQLETGQKQFLPHLTSEIQRISVNASGDRYALQMGDNSIMVLSTAELKPVAYFAGLQMQTGGGQSPAAVLHPQKPKQLLVTVPETQPRSTDKPAPRPFLQTFDLRTARHVTRQALTRNNATDFNTGPEGNAILPPDVKHLAISQDGQWLATADEWMPPASDVEFLASSHAGIKEARQSQREVYLKIWHWDATQEIWTLSTRADSPHRRAGSQRRGAGQVLDLISDPTSNCFATVGEDDCVKLWKPKTRIRGGVAMKDEQDADLIEWTCRRSVQMSSNTDTNRTGSLLDSARHLSAVTAFSHDGSLLAVSPNAPDATESLPAVTFIDTATGTVKAIRTDLTDGTPITALAFLERHLITVTHKAAYVWDLVNDTLVRRIKLSYTEDSRPQLAVNEADQTFALVTPSESPKYFPSHVSIYSTRFDHRAFKQDFETSVGMVLSSGKGSRGFTLLFTDATTRTILPTLSGGAFGPMGMLLAESATEAPAQIDLEEQEEQATEGGSLVAASAIMPGPENVQQAFEVDEDDRPVVRPEQLAAIFDVGPSYAMPPVKDMFSAVVALFARKPQQKTAAATA